MRIKKKADKIVSGSASADIPWNCGISEEATGITYTLKGLKVSFLALRKKIVARRNVMSSARPVLVAFMLSFVCWKSENSKESLICKTDNTVIFRNLPFKDDQITRNPNKLTSELQKGATHLLQISISEAAHLIWVLRCERVIQEKRHNDEEISARWLKAVNRSLTEDKITATVIKKNSPLTQIVEATWEDALKKTSDPPTGWIHDREFLVGRSAQET